MKSKHIMVKDGGVNVRIYVKERTKGGKVYVQYDVVDHVAGVRRFITFADEKRARAKAHEIAARVAPAEFGVIKLTGEDRADYETAASTVRDIGVKLSTVASEYVDARRRLAKMNLAPGKLIKVRGVRCRIPIPAAKLSSRT